MEYVSHGHHGDRPYAVQGFFRLATPPFHAFGEPSQGGLVPGLL